MSWYSVPTAILLLMLQSSSFKQSQLANSRVKIAYQEKESIVQHYFKQKGLTSEGFNLFIRIFKKEQQVETWIKEKGRSTYTLLQVYDVCASSGSLGPKRKEGDLQVPEGIYHIEHFNPLSNFHLSLGINYPNSSDRILSDRDRPGGQIYIHGNCVTVGCIPLTDDKIKELYVLAVEARNNGQSNIPVHIFPSKLEPAEMDALSKQYSSTQTTVDFWKNLQTLYLDFSKTKALKKVNVDRTGKYYF